MTEHVRQNEAQKFFSFKNRSFTRENFDCVIRATDADVDSQTVLCHQLLGCLKNMIEIESRTIMLTIMQIYTANELLGLV